MRNIQHFGQTETEGTSSIQEPLKTKFNYHALMHEDKLVLEGKHMDEDLNKVQQLFTNHLQRITPIDKFDEKIMYEDMEIKIRLWKQHQFPPMVGI